MNENQFWMVAIEGDGIIGNMEYHNFNDARLAAEEFLEMPRYRGLKAYILSPCCYGVSHPTVEWYFPKDCCAATEEKSKANG